MKVPALGPQGVIRAKQVGIGHWPTSSCALPWAGSGCLGGVVTTVWNAQAQCPPDPGGLPRLPGAAGKPFLTHADSFPSSGHCRWTHGDLGKAPHSSDISLLRWEGGPRGCGQVMVS